MASGIAVASSAGDPVRNVLRLFMGAAVALVVTWSLYWLMAELVGLGKEALTDQPKFRNIDFVRVKKDQRLNTQDDKPEKPPKPETPPPEAPKQETKITDPNANVVDIGRMGADASLDIGGIGLSSSDGEYLPIVKVAPIYPRRAQERGLEGWVLLSFTVTETGAVRDPIVIDSEPRGVFDSAAKRAVLKFKYKPRVEDGKAIEVPGVEHLITFKLEN